jgi:phage baseplate assembly protein W
MKDLHVLRLPPPGNPVSPKFNDIEVEDFDLKTVEGVTRKTQDIIKILLTSLGANPVYPTYGSELPNVVGRRATADVTEVILDSIIRALGFVQAIETSTNPAERVKRIISVYVADAPDDPRTRVIRILVAMEDGSIADTSVPMNLGV